MTTNFNFLIITHEYARFRVRPTNPKRHILTGDEQAFYSAEVVAREVCVDNETSDVNTFPSEFHSLTTSGLPLVKCGPKSTVLSSSCEISPPPRLVLTRMSNKALEVKIVGSGSVGRPNSSLALPSRPLKTSRTFHSTSGAVSSQCV